MLKKSFIPFLLCVISANCLLAQHMFETDYSYGSYAIGFTEGETKRMLWFRKSKDSSSVYNILDYRIITPKAGTYNLESEAKYIGQLYQAATDSIEINVTDFAIGYPLNFEDVLSRQIEAFSKSARWKKYAATAKNEIDYGLMRAIMLEADVYAPLSSILKSWGYKIVSLSTEKHGFVDAETLKKLGYTGKEKIPVPFMIWFKITRL